MSEHDRARLYAWLREQTDELLAEYLMSCRAPAPLSDLVTKDFLRSELAREASYDDLNNREQAVVRAEWAERTEQRRRSVDFAAEFGAQGRSYAELDDEGNVVRRQP